MRAVAGFVEKCNSENAPAEWADEEIVWWS
jgi:hypothetical protein